MDKKSPKGRKRSSKGASLGSVGEREDSFWDCSVCTFRNNAEAFKCGVCDVRKGTSTRKPRINPDMVAAQQAQAITPPPTSSTPTPSSSSALRDDDDDASTERTPSRPSGKKPKDGYKPDKPESGVASANGSAKKSKSKDKDLQKKSASTKARLKNVDRSSATYHSVTVNDITVVITEFKPKAKKDKKERKGEKNGVDSSPNGSLSVKASGNNSESNSVDTSNQENVVRNAAENVVNGSRSS